MTPFASPQVQAAFDAFPAHLRPGLLQLRELIFATAAKDKTIGPLEECLKWGQPAYLTSATKSGTTLRLGVSKKTQGKALFVHCQTRLVADFQTQFPDTLSFDGTRALLLSDDADLADGKTQLFIQRALTYHL
ncbi:hypothetical protein TRP8649_00656 [Pelagimonas phthalicica]|uniref:YdhG-like domain-containing protein n=1 Tax=Pelagimonas phthalicica TaxID=1037362 RepID=A0A238J896_9RHOB|nr:DUF1801 domain-containing protein [Pelagimonas phthalicica]TDS94901.1 uncharacterized protein DUF1801 [Pelagimonas phthalicica]SMX26573.1 hypothetical protein TRP8649_00656 [Pelagimonas phthalicica]